MPDYVAPYKPKYFDLDAEVAADKAKRPTPAPSFLDRILGTGPAASATPTPSRTPTPTTTPLPDTQTEQDTRRYARRPQRADSQILNQP